MKNKTILSLCLTATAAWSTNALADGINWGYVDARYQRPTDDDIHGVAGQVSVYMTEHWVLQGGVGYVRLKDDDADLKISQTRLDVSAGRVLNLGGRVSALLSAGYTHLRYKTSAGEFDADARDHVGNAQFILRIALSERFETETGVGLLFDDEDASDVLWNAGLRYHATPSASLLVGANGVASDAFDSDDILYEVGFRFSL